MQNSSEMQTLLARFASLQAAYRALARSVHPAELAPIREQSKSVLIQLQNLSAQAETKPQLLQGPSLDRIDAVLEEQAERTRAILANLEMAQLRATIPALCTSHPKEVAGLVDVLITGDIEDDKSLRTLEYLITMLSAEEVGGRRSLSRHPAKVSDQLRIVSQQKMREQSTVALEAEQTLAAATAKVIQETELGETRDQMREFKQQLGSLLLHPNVLSAAVEYNVAMWNKVAVEIDSSRAMEQLAEEVLDGFSQEQRPSAQSDFGSRPLDSKEFLLLMKAVRARVVGERSEDTRANNLAASLPLDTLRSEDVEVLESDSEEEPVWLMQAAIVLGGLLSKRSEVTGPASVMGLDLEALEAEGLDELLERMTALGRKCFAMSEYAEAFQLADIKTHNLTAHAAARTERAPVGGSQPAVSEPVVANSSWLAGLSLSPAALLILVAVALFALANLDGSQREQPASEAEALQAISPFLANEQPATSDAESHNARLNRAWDYLGTEERGVVAREIGGHFEAEGSTRVVMMDSSNQIAAIYSRGQLMVLTPFESVVDSGL